MNHSLTLRECEYSHYRAAHLTNCVLFLPLVQRRLCDKNKEMQRNKAGAQSGISLPMTKMSGILDKAIKKAKCVSMGVENNTRPGIDYLMTY
jgi:hypothetical protein